MNASAFSVAAGPCSAESQETVDLCAQANSRLGIKYLRAGAYKIRTSAEAYEGEGRQAVEWVTQAAKKYDLRSIIECVDVSHLDEYEHVDIIQIGARNMYNTPLLRATAGSQKTVLLKRAFSATVDEWLKAAEKLDAAGADKIILCERGIRTFETSTRFTLDLAGALIAQRKSGLEVWADPSHASGDALLVPALSSAIYASGLDGLMIEAHPTPKKAKSDSRQTVSLSELDLLFAKLKN